MGSSDFNNTLSVDTFSSSVGEFIDTVHQDNDWLLDNITRLNGYEQNVVRKWHTTRNHNVEWTKDAMEEIPKIRRKYDPTYNQLKDLRSKASNLGYAIRRIESDNAISKLNYNESLPIGEPLQEQVDAAYEYLRRNGLI